MTNTARIQWPDLLKAFAITLVVIGHIVSTFDNRGYHAPIAEWIYSFHMPLFMMLSGMFFKYTLDKPFLPMLKLKCRTLLLPLLSWSIILLIYQLLTITPLSEWRNVTLSWILSGGPLRGYWYLKCLFIFLVVNYVAVKVLKNEILAAFASTILFLLLPNINFTRMMIVFFWLGYLYDSANQRITNRGGYLCAVSAILMIISYALGLYNYTYLGAYGIIDYTKFLVMGTSASLFWITLFNTIFLKPSTNRIIEFISWIGTISLGIYCIHALFYDPIVLGPLLGNLDCHATVVFLLWSIFTLAACVMIIKLILKSKILSFLLLGKKL